MDSEQAQLVLSLGMSRKALQGLLAVVGSTDGPPFGNSGITERNGI